MSNITQPTPTARTHGGLLNLTHLVNPLVLRFAGSRFMPLYGVLEHRGRRSGRLFRTPVVVRRSDDGFIVPMPWGEKTDWCRNIRAAGGCRLRWKGRSFELSNPEVVAQPQVRVSFGPFERLFIRRFGVNQYLRLREA